ncbi:MAG: AarF/ABC1/UbiB kinase family protein [Alphaproteobacteria bacterium]|nr:AarF/ABC1/UbiB kinase family protein [Alphaproteobacteria bacterium]
MSKEDNRFSARASRYAKVGANVGGVAARYAGQRLLGRDLDKDASARDLAKALGGLKGPIMKVAQLLSTIPEALPKEYARELGQLQSQAPPMGPAFVRRRMSAELGRDWQQRFESFQLQSAASASLGQVHRATSLDGRQMACKLQYPDMQSAVEADLNQLKLVFQIHARMEPGVDTREIFIEISSRLREELDYALEARHTRLYSAIFAHEPMIRVPEIDADLSTGRLLTMTWLDGNPLLSFKEHPLEDRNQIARAMFKAWWYPFSHYGVIHGDPHLGNYTVFGDSSDESSRPQGINLLDYGEGTDADRPLQGTSAATDNRPRPKGINLLDYGCIRTFPPVFVQGVVNLYRGLLENDRDRVVAAYEQWGFKGLNNELIDGLTIWAKFIYGPLLDNRERTIADQTTPGEYGRSEMMRVRRVLKDNGPVTVPREFVFMDRAAIGLGGVFLHLDAKLNWYRLFNETIEDFDLEEVSRRQKEAFTVAQVPLPEENSPPR